MSEEDKRLLLIDLSARLPYGVKVHIDCEPYVTTIDSVYNLVRTKKVNGHDYYKAGVDVTEINSIDSFLSVDEVKPYLRPISSMTGKESDEYHSINTGSIRGDMVAKIDFYLKNHFDFRITSEGLSMIEAGLALEAPDGIY